MSDRPPAEPSGPADDYLLTHHYDIWDVIEFLKAHKLTRTPEQLSHSWVSALRRVSNCTVSTKAKKKSARRLLALWSSRDHKRWKAWECGLSQLPVSSYININNLSNLQKCSVNIGLPDGKPEIAKTLKRKSQNVPSNRKIPRYSNAQWSSDAEKRLSLFEARLHDIKNFWILIPGGSSVEHTLAGYVRSHNIQETPAHSLIVDTNDPDIKKLFSAEEWNIIMASLPNTPDSSPVLKSYLETFQNQDDLDSIKEILENGAFFMVPDNTLDTKIRRKTYQNLAWAHLVLTWVVSDYTNGHIALTDNREKWFQTHIWTALFDRLFENIAGVRFISGECPTDATVSRKPAKAGNRRNPGRFHDAVMRYCEFEIGAVENGGCSVKPNGTKWCSDTMKLVKVSRDMIVKIHGQFGNGVQMLPILGLVTGGLNFKTYYTVYGGGSVCVLGGNTTITLPTKLEHFGSFAAALLHMWEVKMVMEETTGTLRRLTNLFSYGKSRSLSPELLGSIETDPPTDEDTIDHSIS